MKLRILKEGAGAGYTITAKGLSDIDITFAAPERFVVNDKEYVKGWLVSVDGTCTIDKLEANSYMYGTGEIYDVPCKINRVWVDWYSVDDDVDLMNPETVDDNQLIEIVKEALYNIDDISYTYGGGWTHSTYDGTIGEITEKNSDAVELQITSESVINYIDEAVMGENTYTTFQIVIDGYDIYDTVEDEDEALQIANDLTYDENYKDLTITVDRVTEYVDYEGNEIDTTTEQIWEV